MTTRIASLLLGLLAATPAQAFRLYTDEEAGRHFDFEGYAQPYLRWVADPCVHSEANLPPAPCERGRVPDGFGLARARLGVSGAIHPRVRFKLELRTLPNVELNEARFRFRLVDTLQLTAGRFKVPFGAQALTSGSRQQLISRAALVDGNPGRQLGLMLGWRTGPWMGGLPKGFLRLWTGVFNGESGTVVNNIDDEYLFAARVEVAPFGAPEGRFQGDVRPVAERAAPLLVAAGSWTRETRGPDNGNYEQQRLGADLSFWWCGAFLYGEFYRHDRDYVRDGADPDRHGQGWSVQAGFFVPAPYVEEHLEIAGRVEEWDPDVARLDARADELRSPIPGAGPGRSGSTQGHRAFVAGLNWYFLGHDLKLQANYTHRQPTEAWSLSAAQPEVDDDVDDDSFFLQLTVRI